MCGSSVGMTWCHLHPELEGFENLYSIKWSTLHIVYTFTSHPMQYAYAHPCTVVYVHASCSQSLLY